MLTRAEQFLQMISTWAYDRRAYDPKLAPELPVELWSWRTVGAAAERLRLPDGSRAVNYVETNCREKGLINDITTFATYSHDRIIRIAAWKFSARALTSVFHEFAHAMLHYNVSEDRYKQDYAWIESEADVTCDLVRMRLGAGPRLQTMRQLDALGSESDMAAFFHFAGDVIIEAAEAIHLAFREAVDAGHLQPLSEL